MTLPRIIAWEITRACNLHCLHCRASATSEPDPAELTLQEGFDLLDQLKQGGTRMVILSGGEALFRPDVFEIAQQGTFLGLRMTLATNGSLVTRETAAKIRQAGIVRVSVSLDGVTAEVHDNFRGLPGAFDMALQAIEHLRAAGVPVQINTTVAAANISQMGLFPAFIRSIGAMAWHVFFLVPTGRGQHLPAARIREYRDMLEAFHTVSRASDFECKATCAPQYYRMIAEKEGSSPTKGCLAGTGFGFVSSRGIVQPCGFLQIACGDIRKNSLSEIWEMSDTLRLLRSENSLKGKCLDCAYNAVCGGCRARAFEMMGDIMEQDPICWFPG
jgi:radical SAM protein with 4Fe4S-binding SPASM domain